MLVLVVAAADPDAVEAQLRPQLGDLLCVVTSRWTKAELDAVRAHLHAHWEQWNLYGLGPSNGEDGDSQGGRSYPAHGQPAAHRARQYGVTRGG